MRKNKIKIRIIIGAALILAILFLRGCWQNNLSAVLGRLSLTEGKISRLVFKVDYAGCLPAGEFVLEKEQTVDEFGNTMCQFRARARPSGIVDFFCQPRMDSCSLAEPGDFLPRTFTQNLEIRGTVREKKIIVYDQEDNIMEIEEEGSRTQRLITPETYDPLSLFFFLSEKADLAPGKTIDLNVNANQKNYRFLGEVLGKENHYAGGRNFEIWRIRGKVQRREGGFRHSSTFTVFLAEQPVRIPVLIKIFTNLGTVSARLVSAEILPEAVVVSEGCVLE